MSQSIEQWIRDGRLAPGGRLPTEKTLASEFGVSRAVVREAVSRLKAEGLITTRQGAGAFVAARPGAATFRLAASGAGAAGEALDHVFELRYIVETAAAAMAARRRTAADLAALREALGGMDDALARGEDGTEADDAFHTAVAAATGNPAVGRFIRFMGGQFFASRVPTWDARGHAQGWARDSQREHHQLFDAILAQDVSAARAAARAHLVHAAARLGVDASDWDEAPRMVPEWEGEQ
ncbi:FadR/GntR family transcriptional regulator [Nitrogeniibacter mangrovi]|uniref:FadR/GntR family transcriptional regulator n=1 Tax=Nitrogeniibacter mangrovi TaxID=2016596 RepID=UPI00226A3DE4|nr:FCD domain-containing protein [Nitrogeniibacter mangrovi]